MIAIHKERAFHFDVTLLSSTAVCGISLIQCLIFTFRIFALLLAFSQGCCLIGRCTKKEKHSVEHKAKLQPSSKPPVRVKSPSPGIACTSLVHICNIPHQESPKSLTHINTWSWVWKRELRLETGNPGGSHSYITWKEALRTRRNKQQIEKQKPISCNATLLVKPDLSSSICQAD